MELRHLRYFVTVARELNFRRAALRLHVAQPALSRQIHDLEAEIEVQLFTRIGKRCRLTKAGEAFLADAERIISQVNEGVRKVQQVDRGETGEFSLGYDGSLFHKVIPSILKKIRRAFPSLCIQLKNLAPCPQSTAVLQGDIDLGLIAVADMGIQPTLRTERVHTSRLVAMTHEDHQSARAEKVSLSSLAQDCFLVAASKSCPGAAVHLHQICRAKNFVPKILCGADHAQSIITRVAAGCGIAIVPEELAAMPHHGTVFKPLTPKLTVEFHAIWRADNRTRVLTDCLAIIKQVCRQEMSVKATRSRPGKGAPG